MNKYKIIVKGEAEAKIGKDWEEITNSEDLAKLDGVDCQDNFSEYFDNDFTYKNAVTGGYMDFKFEDGKLWAYTKYNSNRLLTNDELHDLQEYTQGQWSDGIGEGFEQHPCMYDEYGKEIFISPWFFGQKISTIQEKI